MSEAAPEHVNEIHLVGRMSDVPIERVMPSGDVLVTWTLVVQRARPVPGHPGHDRIECATFLAGIRRSVLKWGPGDVLEVDGALRRRFFGAPKVSRYQVEVLGIRRLDRAPRASAPPAKPARPARSARSARSARTA